jgi:SAM-dependent methyltransferase
MTWDEAFTRRYGEWSAHMTEDVAFYVELAREADGPLVELAIGNGRVAIRVAQATGRSVSGIDTSPAMLERAPARASETGERVAASLRPGGRFAWNAFAFDHQIAARLDGQHEDEPMPHAIRYAVGDNRIDITLADGGTSSLWWATKNEWLGLLDVAGLELEALLGSFDGKPLDDDSREYIFVARR